MCTTKLLLRLSEVLQYFFVLQSTSYQDYQVRSVLIKCRKAVIQSKTAVTGYTPASGEGGGGTGGGHMVQYCVPDVTSTDSSSLVLLLCNAAFAFDLFHHTYILYVYTEVTPPRRPVCKAWVQLLHVLYSREGTKTNRHNVIFSKG